jgi:hypothetical protein
MAGVPDDAFHLLLRELVGLGRLEEEWIGDGFGRSTRPQGKGQGKKKEKQDAEFHGFLPNTPV